MKIHGFNKLTLLDYPGHTAAVLFLGHCNFRCQFCQNRFPCSFSWSRTGSICSRNLFFFKKKTGNFGRCLHYRRRTYSFSWSSRTCLKLKVTWISCQISTNGSRPDVLKSLVAQNLIDYVAMDIKSSPKRYPFVCGYSSISSIEESVSFLLHSSIPYEFRTTVVKELHCEEDFQAISQWICGCRQYFFAILQRFTRSIGARTAQLYFAGTPSLSCHCPKNHSSRTAARCRLIPG